MSCFRTMGNSTLLPNMIVTTRNPLPARRGATIENKLNQFICLQILETTATVIVVNKGSGIADGQVSIFGTTANKPGTVSDK